MIESFMFACPREAREEGLAACADMREALRLLREKAPGSPAEAFVEPLSALLACHEASLWSAVDFHGLLQLEHHHLSCCRTKALLEGAAEEIALPDAADTERLRLCLARAAAAAGRSGRPCRVGEPGAHLGLTRAEEYR